jgi:hypothetical protein
LVVGCVLGTINCCLTSHVLFANAAAVAQFDGFLKSSEGKIYGMAAAFLAKMLTVCRVCVVCSSGVCSCFGSFSKGVIFWGWKINYRSD